MHRRQALSPSCHRLKPILFIVRFRQIESTSVCRSSCSGIVNTYSLVAVLACDKTEGDVRMRVPVKFSTSCTAQEFQANSNVQVCPHLRSFFSFSGEMWRTCVCLHAGDFMAGVHGWRA